MFSCFLHFSLDCKMYSGRLIKYDFSFCRHMPSNLLQFTTTASDQVVSVICDLLLADDDDMLVAGIRGVVPSISCLL